ncbi:MAG: aromatic ring-hydroxylating dioxygenase subunit alpha [Alphaproteobacteria bacterium]|nr:aromatic ring-hydroxylating dioxygenase subunit alpha [Alphaproteobacteria bacterium]
MAAEFRNTADTYTAGARTLPQRYLTSPEIFAAEQQRIFAARWVCAAHVHELAEPGAFVLREVAGESLILVRGADGGVHCHYNVCRHRGSRMCERESGRFTGAIRCPYHSWTYELDGRLRAAPHMDGVPGFDHAGIALRSAQVGIWEGLVFVNVGREPTPFESAFAPLLGKFARWNLPLLRAARRIDYDVAANWKLLFENFSECYHCPGVHPALAKLTPYNKAENDLSEGPFLGGFMPIRSGGSITTSGNACALPLGALDAEEQGRVYYYSNFPNLLLSLHPDYAMVHTLWPRAPAQTTVRCEWLFHPDAFGRADFRPDDAVGFCDVTNRQDWHVCELNQQGVASRAYEPGPYSPRESIAAAFDREYLRAMCD